MHKATAALTVSGAFLAAWMPTSLWGFGRCAFLTATGFPCPFCGGTRSLHAFAHGHLGEALYWNPYVTFLTVIGLIWATAVIFGWRAPLGPQDSWTGLLAATLTALALPDST